MICNDVQKLIDYAIKKELITNDDIIPETTPEDDIFSSLGDMGKNFPSNIRID